MNFEYWMHYVTLNKLLYFLPTREPYMFGEMPWKLLVSCCSWCYINIKCHGGRERVCDPWISNSLCSLDFSNLQNWIQVFSGSFSSVDSWHIRRSAVPHFYTYARIVASYGEIVLRVWMLSFWFWSDSLFSSIVAISMIFWWSFPN